MNITKNQLACLRQLAPGFDSDRRLKFLLALIDSIAAEKGWDVSKIEPDPEMLAKSLEDYKNGRYLTTEQYLQEIKDRKDRKEK
jgi:hypothetical protein